VPVEEARELRIACQEWRGQPARVEDHLVAPRAEAYGHAEEAIVARAIARRPLDERHLVQRPRATRELAAPREEEREDQLARGARRGRHRTETDEARRARPDLHAEHTAVVDESPVTDGARQGLAERRRASHREVEHLERPHGDRLRRLQTEALVAAQPHDLLEGAVHDGSRHAGFALLEQGRGQSELGEESGRVSTYAYKGTMQRADGEDGDRSGQGSIVAQERFVGAACQEFGAPRQ
jgi:hypothetical protein